MAAVAPVAAPVAAPVVAPAAENKGMRKVCDDICSSVNSHISTQLTPILLNHSEELVKLSAMTKTHENKLEEILLALQRLSADGAKRAVRVTGDAEKKDQGEVKAAPAAEGKAKPVTKQHANSMIYFKARWSESPEFRESWLTEAKAEIDIANDPSVKEEKDSVKRLKREADLFWKKYISVTAAFKARIKEEYTRGGSVKPEVVQLQADKVVV